MPQSLSSVYVHAVFSTKDRHPYFADPELRNRFHCYLGGVSKQIDCQPLTIGGVEDHVHILAAQGRTISQADWIKEIKRISNRFMKEHDERFAWQSGYGIFSVDPSNLDRIRQYIAGQEEHHRKVSFQEEYRALLAEHSIVFDERYMWD